MRYNNPILSGFHPDPSICRKGKDFYLITSTFEFFPGVPIYHSQDLVNWTPIGHVLSRESQLPLSKAYASGGIFAPTIRYHDGRFYMVTTNISNGGNFYVWTEDPAGEWSDPIWIDEHGIDPSFWFDDNGKVYFVSTNSKQHPGKGGAFQSEIDLKTGKMIGESHHLWTGTGGQYPEGPHVFKKDGWYYVLMAEGGTEFGHMVTIARSRTIDGPYTPCPRNPILSHRSLNTPLQSTGHSDLIEDEQGRWWLVFLACRHQGYPKMHHIGRETSLCPVEWDAEGWPIINGGKPVELVVETDRLSVEQIPAKASKDDFDAPKLALEWNFRRNPDASAWSLSKRPGSLSLRCVAATMKTPGATAWVGRRQQQLACTARTWLDFQPQQSTDEAGLMLFLNENYRVDVAITRREGRRVAILRRILGTLTAEPAICPIPEGPVMLEVRAEPEWYHLSVTPQGQAAIDLGKVETRHLSTELAGGFTGVYFAMYATGNGVDSQGQAHFDAFEYIPQ